MQCWLTVNLQAWYLVSDGTKLLVRAIASIWGLADKHMKLNDKEKLLTDCDKFEMSGPYDRASASICSIFVSVDGSLL